MDYQYNTSKSSKAVVNFALLFFWIAFPLLAYMFLTTVFALITRQAILSRAFTVLIASTYGLFIVITLPFQLVNQYNRIRVTKEGLYVEVYIFRYVWKFVGWDEILDLKLLSRFDRWGKPQWLIKVRKLTYWHRWISLHYLSGLDPGIVINSDLINGDQLLQIVDKKLSRMTAEASEKVSTTVVESPLTKDDVQDVHVSRKRRPTKRAPDSGYAPRFQALSWLWFFSVSRARPRSQPLQFASLVRQPPSISLKISSKKEWINYG